MLLRKEPEQEDVPGWKSGHLHALCTLLRYYYKIRTRHALINRRCCSRPRIKTITSRTGFYGIKNEKPAKGRYYFWIGGGIQIRTGEWRFCRPLPYHLAMPPKKISKKVKNVVIEKIYLFLRMIPPNSKLNCVGSAHTL
jgi:hypothetical protein